MAPNQITLNAYDSSPYLVYFIPAACVFLFFIIHQLEKSSTTRGKIYQWRHLALNKICAVSLQTGVYRQHAASPVESVLWRSGADATKFLRTLTGGSIFEKWFDWPESLNRMVGVFWLVGKNKSELRATNTYNLNK